ncbi:hypothetical protein ILYODFUR_024956 [Ilyodon furcidens]|uniref:Uncharacterized protein n=1 Tax=Ilyodon furcidens TaxID=33524 RepID=A0ABV0TLF7_9TELE
MPQLQHLLPLRASQTLQLQLLPMKVSQMLLLLPLKVSQAPQLLPLRVILTLQLQPHPLKVFSTLQLLQNSHLSCSSLLFLHPFLGFSVASSQSSSVFLPSLKVIVTLHLLPPLRDKKEVQTISCINHKSMDRIDQIFSMFGFFKWCAN